MNASRLVAAADFARQSLISARLLWREGQVADSYRHAATALTRILAAWGDSDPNQARLEPGAWLMASEAGFRHGPEMDEVLRAHAVVVPPAGDRDYTAEHQRLFEQTWALADRLCMFTRGLLQPAAARRRLRRIRIAVVAVLAAAALTFVIGLGTRPIVTASASFSPEFPATNAADGTLATEWLLPNGELGSLDIAFPTARTVQQVQLRNSHNRHYMDRAARRIRVTLFARDRRQAAVEAEFGPVAIETPDLLVPVSGSGIALVRVEILSYFGTGGGLAEVRVD